MKFKQLKVLFICICGSFMLASTPVYAGADSGFYMGAGAGDASVELLTFDENDLAYKVFGGYNFGYVPLVDLAVEASYVDFGNPASNNINIEVSGFNAFGLAGLNFGPFGIFAKVGLINWDTSFRIDAIKSSDDGLDPAYGIGAKFHFGSLAVRAEYELYDIDNLSDISMVSASLVYTF